eukprot:Rhum_TRINITY_DN13197_c1_g1::Rhum_TRINITY_DN13197_c1_g1_i1::g.57812::m.57812
MDAQANAHLRQAKLFHRLLFSTGYNKDGFLCSFAKALIIRAHTAAVKAGKQPITLNESCVNPTSIKGHGAPQNYPSLLLDKACTAKSSPTPSAAAVVRAHAASRVGIGESNGASRLPRSPPLRAPSHRSSHAPSTVPAANASLTPRPAPSRGLPPLLARSSSRCLLRGSATAKQAGVTPSAAHRHPSPPPPPAALEEAHRRGVCASVAEANEAKPRAASTAAGRPASAPPPSRAKAPLTLCPRPSASGTSLVRCRWAACCSAPPSPAAPYVASSPDACASSACASAAVTPPSAHASATAA